MGIFDRMRGDTIRVRVLIRGRVGDIWRDVDDHVRLPHGTTLGKLVEVADAAQVPLRDTLDRSPNLAETMMLNGERCPFVENSERELKDGDELTLVAPVA